MTHPSTIQADEQQEIALVLQVDRTTPQENFEEGVQETVQLT